MKTDIELVFRVLVKRYESLLNRYYPAHNSTGFTERNLSVNFAAAFQNVYPISLVW